ncbi:hypothetical protein D7044_13890 [Micromonospora musae]|uniref:Uncharacterized protein n=1 Tax=Micromonospora musae TaxID=1894970 RepID=A0A3A9Y4Y2_9ACTN|nr:hypothetical protein D7044_13890 [Micromonospora musae]
MPDEALGRSRGGLSTKIHLATDGRRTHRPAAMLAGLSRVTSAAVALRPSRRTPRGWCGKRGARGRRRRDSSSVIIRTRPELDQFGQMANPAPPDTTISCPVM